MDLFIEGAVSEAGAIITLVRATVLARGHVLVVHALRVCALVPVGLDLRTRRILIAMPIRVGPILLHNMRIEPLSPSQFVWLSLHRTLTTIAFKEPADILAVFAAITITVRAFVRTFLLEDDAHVEGIDHERLVRIDNLRTLRRERAIHYC